MKKDIVVPKVEDVAVAVISETNELGAEEWNAFLINLQDKPLTGVLVSSRGYGQNPSTGEKVKTSTLRHFLDTIDAKSCLKIEPLLEDVLGLSNEYWVSFYQDSTMYDKKYVFVAESIKKDNFVQVPILEKQGVMIK